MIKIYHNNRCGKSRECLAFLGESGHEVEIVNYLVDAPSPEEIRSLLSKLGISPLQLVRQKEPIWIDNYKGKSLTDQEIINAMSEHPILIERPIVINGDKAVIARPAEKASDII